MLMAQLIINLSPNLYWNVDENMDVLLTDGIADPVERSNSSSWKSQNESQDGISLESGSKNIIDVQNSILDTQAVTFETDT